MEDIFRPLTTLWMLGKRGDGAGGFKHLPKACLSSHSAGGPSWKKPRPQVQLKGMIQLFLLKVAQLLEAPHWNGHCPKTSQLGMSFSAPLPSKFASRATREVGRNLWDEAMSSLAHLCKPKGATHSSACCEGAEKEGVALRGCLLPGRGPGQPLQNIFCRDAEHLFRSCFRHYLKHMDHPALTAHSMFHFRPGHLSRICPSRDCGAAWHTQATPCENMGSDSDLSAFIHRAQTSVVPPLLAGQLLSWVLLYHLQQFVSLRYPPHWAPMAALSLCS